MDQKKNHFYVCGLLCHERILLFRISFAPAGKGYTGPSGHQSYHAPGLRLPLPHFPYQWSPYQDNYVTVLSFIHCIIYLFFDKPMLYNASHPRQAPFSSGSQLGINTMHKGGSFACLANLYVSCLMGLNGGNTHPYLHLSSCLASRSHRPPAGNGFQERSGLGTNDRVRHFVKAISA